MNKINEIQHVVPQGKGKAAKTKKDYPIDNGMTVKLTDQQYDFCVGLASGKTPTQARLAAGYTDYHIKHSGNPDKARQFNAQSAIQLMNTSPDIAIYANYLQSSRRQKLSLTIDDLLKTTAAIIHFDPAMLFDANGGPIENIWDIPYQARMALKKLKTSSYVDANGNPVIQNEYEFYSKIDAINMLTRLQEIAKDKMSAKLSGKKLKLQRQGA